MSSEHPTIFNTVDMSALIDKALQLKS